MTNFERTLSPSETSSNKPNKQFREKRLDWLLGFDLCSPEVVLRLKLTRLKRFETGVWPSASFPGGEIAQVKVVESSGKRGTENVDYFLKNYPSGPDREHSNIIRSGMANLDLTIIAGKAKKIDLEKN